MATFCEQVVIVMTNCALQFGLANFILFTIIKERVNALAPQPAPFDREGKDGSDKIRFHGSVHGN